MDSVSLNTLLLLTLFAWHLYACKISPCVCFSCSKENGKMNDTWLETSKKHLERRDQKEHSIFWVVATCKTCVEKLE